MSANGDVVDDARVRASSSGTEVDVKKIINFLFCIFFCLLAVNNTAYN